MVLDPIVNQVLMSGQSKITSAMADSFRAKWTAAPKPSFSQLLTGTDNALHFLFPNYYRKEVCEKYEFAGSPAQIMGTNADNDCVYWDWTDNPFLYECLNDVSLQQLILM